MFNPDMGHYDYAQHMGDWGEPRLHLDETPPMANHWPRLMSKYLRKKLQHIVYITLFTMVLSAVNDDALAQEAKEGSQTENSASELVITYGGVPDQLRGSFKLISELEKSLRTYPTMAALKRGAQRDASAFTGALKSAGYYAGQVSFEVKRGQSSNDRRVEFIVQPGPSFRIIEYEILYEDEYPARPLSFDDTDITPDNSAAGADLQEVQLQFLNHLRNNGYPVAEIIARRAIANIDSGTASAVFVFKSGPKGTFGDAVIKGTKKTKTSYLHKLKTWEVGDRYEREKITGYRDSLAQTGLFTTIDVVPGAPDETGMVPVLLNVEERKRRSIGAGLSYSTIDGPGGRLFFENRNIFGSGETLKIDVLASQLEQSINFNANKPLPNLPGLAYANFEFANETTEAFDAQSIALRGGFAKNWLEDRLITRAGLALETSDVTTDGISDRNYFVSAPLSVSWNSEDDLLDPQRGFQARWSVTPYLGSANFTQSEFSARSRIFLGSKKRFTLAGRAALGASFGSSFADLPANKRFYTGGAGSVRGFGFQEAGALDANDSPIGGRSLVAGAIEARMKVSGKIQLAAFADAGSVSQSALPNFNEDIFVSVGGGVRYYTPIGPIRADVAIPLNKRESDRGFQILISIGQPF